MEPGTRKRIMTTVAVAVALVGGGGAVAVAGNMEEDASETAITGDALNRAGSAALTFIGEGTVTGTEIGDEESYYEVEVTRGDGSQVDVQLDETFTVVGSKADTEDDG
ncbi:PepSY domain-containing protein [Arthrobacter sp. HLT1-21]